MAEEMENRAWLVEMAVLGEQVSAFLNTDIGRYMTARSEDLKSQAMDALKACDPTDANQVRKYQNAVWLAENVMQWMKDAIVGGLQAIEQIDDRES